MRKLGKKRQDRILPEAFELEKRPETVRELITGLTRLCVRAYNLRKDEGQLLPYLTKDEITDMASAGKVSFGVRGGNDADEESAVANSLQCFEDGIFRVFADEDELTDLEQEIPWKDGLMFTFVRLAMLAGW